MNTRTLAASPGATATLLADLAVRSLIEEALLTPKPGLVDRRGSGSHTDMDVYRLIISAESLRDGFADMALAAQALPIAGPALRAELARIGRAAEARMLEATGGVNTHRGAIWALGLLTGAAAIDVRNPWRTAADIAGHEDPSAPAAPALSHGEVARFRYGVGGARAEAAAGFPHARIAHAILRRARDTGLSETQAKLDALLAVMASLKDTCLLHRGGPEGLAFAQNGAHRVLRLGGTATAAGQARLAELDDALAARRLSPGGSADLLAAAIYVDSLDSLHTERNR